MKRQFILAALMLVVCVLLPLADASETTVPTLLWKRSIGNSNFSPALANHTVYLASGSTVFAFNAANGMPVWNYTADQNMWLTPAVANGTLYVGGRNYVLALDAQSGRLLWESIYEDARNFSTPTLAEGVVYVGAVDGGFFAINAKNGNQLWSYKFYLTNGHPNHSAYSQIWAPASVVDDVVYFGASDGNIYALNAQNGVRLWNYTTGDFIMSSPIISDGILYFGSGDGSFYALNASCGSKLWSFKTSSYITSTPAIANGLVYMGSMDGTVYAFNNNGDKLWNYSNEAWTSYFSSSPVVDGSTLYVGSSDGNLYALNASSGEKLWNLKLSNTSLTSPVIDGGILLISAPAASGFGQPVGSGDVYAVTIGDSLTPASNPYTLNLIDALLLATGTLTIIIMVVVLFLRKRKLPVTAKSTVTNPKETENTL